VVEYQGFDHGQFQLELQAEEILKQEKLLLQKM
jgi:hypothetical protein